MAAPQPTLDGLAATIAQTAKAISGYLETNGFPAPSFAEGGPEDYPKTPEVQGLRFQLVGALVDMLNLAMGPVEMTFLSPLLANHDTMTLDVLNQFDFFSAVPLGGSATYADIARTTKLAEPIVRRFLRHAMTMRYFAEAPPGSDTVVHTANSACVVKRPLLHSWLSHNMEEIRPGALHVPAALRAFSSERPSEEIIESGFSIADIDKTGRPTTYWDYLKRTPEGKPEGYRAKRFAEAMQAATAVSVVNRDEQFKQGFDWASLGEATLVDIGGSSGHDAKVLAQYFPKLKFIVQDLPEVEGAFNANVPGDLASRVSFQKHDFFTPQTTAADAYLLKMILHDWPDKYAIKILGNIVPSLKAGGRILIMDMLSPPAHDGQGNELVPLQLRRLASGVDLQMLVAFNSRERDLEAWKSLISRTDERLELRNVTVLPGLPWATMEVVFNG